MMTPNERTLVSQAAKRILARDPRLAEEIRATPAARTAAREGTQRNHSAERELAFETVVLAKGRPVLAVQQNGFKASFTDPESEFWRKPLQSARAALVKAIPAVGRIEVSNHPQGMSWVGTGWLVDDDVIVTNRHVAAEFGRRNGSGFVFSVGRDRREVGVQIDFLEEFGRDEALEFRVNRVLHIEDDDGPDVAFLRVDGMGGGDAARIDLARNGAAPDKVAAIGYPARDSRVPDQSLVLSIFGDIYDKKRLAPGKVIDSAPDLLQHDCSTLGGNSGSVLLDLDSGTAVGLHFGGLYLQANHAVPARVVADRLARLRDRGRVAVPDRPRREDPVGPAVRFDAASGEATWTVPIQVTVRVGAPVPAGGGAQAGAGHATGGSVEAAVAKARAALRDRRDVVGVRAGYLVRDGQLTDQRAVVVVVRGTRAEALAREGRAAIPESFDGVPVDVTPATPWDLVQLGAVPREEGLDLEKVPATHYVPPDDVRLERVDEEMTMICHVSPDNGWPQLSQFLAATKRKLTVGMYDFTAPHIVDAVKEAVEPGSRRMNLVIQRKASLGSGTKKNDIDEDDVIDQLRDLIGDRLQQSWASVSGANRLFASSYHIKVAVRDGKAFWLSSGNWQSSNQPAKDPVAAGDTSSHLLNNYNRDWHVIVENPKLARQFEKFLEYDLEQAAQVGEEGLEAVRPSFLVPRAYFRLDEEALEKPARYFAPKVFTKRLDVMPLLTPDNYGRHVLKLIRGATRSVLFQNQSFNLLDDNEEAFQDLAQALLDQQRNGLDVRILLRGDFDPRPILERLKDFGFDMDRVRTQKGCHTKGIIVDGERVLIGSQNWTNQGTTVNRDASLIVSDAEVARYYQDIFEFDWQRVGPLRIDESIPAVALSDDFAGEVPSGMVRVSWDEVFED